MNIVGRLRANPNSNPNRHPVTAGLVALLAALLTTASSARAAPAAPTVAATPTPTSSFAPVTVRHQLGTTVVAKLPARVAALDMNEVDFLDQLEVPVAGMPKDFIPDFLAKYRNAPEVADLGAIVQPNLERVHAARPDLILITSLQASQYEELSRIAPTLQFDVDYRNSQTRHIEVIRDHLLTLGRIFGKEERARRQAAALDAQVAQARQAIQDRPERALIVLHNNGAFSAFGPKSRYGFVFSALGVKPAVGAADAGLHGQPVSSEFIRQADPDIVYIVDRTAVMERRPALNADSLSNPLLRQTKAWKHGRVVFVDAQAWYVTAASPTSIRLIVDDVLKGYRR